MAQNVIEILDGDRAGETVPLGDRPLKIGRKSGNDVVLKDEKASGVHAEIGLEDGRFVLRDLGSTNGTLMDGRRVTEVALSPGDRFQIGLVHIRFSGGDEAVGTGGGVDALQMLRVDQARLSSARSSRSVALLGVLVVVAAAVGAWLYLRSDRGGNQPGTRGGPGQPIAVKGNRLPGPVAGCEGAEGWELQADGFGFSPDGPPHTGASSLQAFHPGAGDGEAAIAGFALAHVTDPLPVLAGRALRVVAHLRTEGQARAGVRLHFYSSVADHPFAFRVGSPVIAFEDWEQVEFIAAVPPLCDRAELELVADLPGVDDAALADDLAIVEAGNGETWNEKVEATGQILIGTGPSVAVSSPRRDQPVVLVGLRPLAGDGGPLAGLARARLTCLSDVGAGLAVENVERGFLLSLSGSTGLILDLPSESGGGLLVRADDGPFLSVAADAADVTAREVLLGAGAARCMVRLAEPQKVSGLPGSAGFGLSLPDAAALELWVNFRQERNAANELLDGARRQRGQGAPGEALDTLRTLVADLPHDTEHLRTAEALRAEILADQAQELLQARADLEKARFFRTRGGFVRVIETIDDIVARYGEHNVEEGETVAAARSTAAEELATLDGDRSTSLRERLEDLAKAFSDADQSELAELVQGYLSRHGGQ